MIGVIADDLTGAAEIGAVGLRHGLRSEIVRRGLPSGEADLICMDTDSRACEPEEAAARAVAAASALRAAGATWIYKKVDSVLRGQVTAEVEAVMQELKLDRALLLPANPSLGRTIKAGHYFVGGQLLHKTEFLRDPMFPRLSSQVLRLVRPPEHFAMRSAAIGGSFDRGTLLIGNAETAAEVQDWAAGYDADTLPVGGSEFFNALLHLQRPQRQNIVAAAPEAGTGAELFLVGTSTQAARKFVTTERQRKTPVFSLPQELAWGAEFTEAAVAAVTQRVLAALESQPRVILNVGLPLVRDAAIARRLSDEIARVAEPVLRRSRVTRVFAEGGATAAELVRRMDWARLDVLRELAPGVATLAIEGEKNLWLTIKPGTYSWPAAWL